MGSFETEYQKFMLSQGRSPPYIQGIHENDSSLAEAPK